MRRRLAVLAVAVTALVVIAFLVPLGLLVRSQARDRALAGAQREAQAVAAGLSVAAALQPGQRVDAQVAELVLAASGDPAGASVFLPGGQVAGTPATSPNLAAARTGSAFTVDVPGGSEVLVPVSAGGEVAVVRSFVPAADQRRGVVAAWLLLAGLGIVLVGVAVAVADRLGRTVVAPVRDLAETAHRLGEGDLDARAAPAGPPEVAELGDAFNLLAGRLRDLLAAEREAVADLSHRLRTPLAAVRLQAESLADEEARDALLSDLDALEQAVTQVIAEARRPPAAREARADLAAVVRGRTEFWRVLAEEQERDLVVAVPDSTVPVALPAADLGALVDTLLENVFAHTPPGVPFSVAVDGARRLLVVEDAGPGPPPTAATRRGASGSGSTGLGLDIVRRAAERSGGGLAITRSNSGGTRATVTFGAPPG